MLPPTTALNEEIAEDHNVETTVVIVDATEEMTLILFSVWHPQENVKNELQFDGLNVPAQNVGLNPPVHEEELQNQALQVDVFQPPVQNTALNPSVQLAELHVHPLHVLVFQVPLQFIAFQERQLPSVHVVQLPKDHAVHGPGFLAEQNPFGALLFHATHGPWFLALQVEGFLPLHVDGFLVAQFPPVNALHVEEFHPPLQVESLHVQPLQLPPLFTLQFDAFQELQNPELQVHPRQFPPPN